MIPIRHNSFEAIIIFLHEIDDMIRTVYRNDEETENTCDSCQKIK